MQGCCIRAGGAIAAHCLGWQSEAPGQQHWRTTPCAVGNSCVLPTARLFCSTGERNGFTVLTEAEFYDFHLTTPDLSVMLMRVGAHALGMLAGQAKQAERLPSATFWLIGPTRPAQLPPHHAPCTMPPPCAGQGRREHHHLLHRRAGGGHAHAHVVRCCLPGSV